MTTPARKAYFPRETEDEYRAARRYFTRKATREVAEAFRAEVIRGVAFIERFPEASPVIGGEVRRLVLRRPFEYSIFYVVEPDRIRILAVAHHRQEPGYWRDRLPT